MFEGLISSEFKDLFNGAIDAILADAGLTVPCRFIYSGTKYTVCPNCSFNNLTGKSTNVYKIGGPIPFTSGVCPYCRGDGRFSEQETEDIYLAVLWDYKKWLPMPTSLHTPEGYVQTLSKKSTTLTKIRKATEILVDVNIDADTHHRFVREGEPNPMGFGDNCYIATMWKRA